MKAVVFAQYGPPEVLQYKELEKPQPKDDEVLIKIHATSGHIGDTRVRRADPIPGEIGFWLIQTKEKLSPWNGDVGCC